MDINIYRGINVYTTANTDISTGERDFYVGTGLATFDFKIGFSRGDGHSTPNNAVLVMFA